MLRVVRAEYSVLEAGGRILPHFGMTNGHIKLHLGLVVPSLPGGQPCAFLTVAGEERPWVQDSVLVFDDSFLHHVRSDCVSERVVFQLVVVHPDVSAPATGRSEL
jgi:aspartyl/asparaginyl beta-hydroxylase (cupin superfamily)